MHDDFRYIAPGHRPHHRTRCFETMEEVTRREESNFIA